MKRRVKKEIEILKNNPVCGATIDKEEENDSNILLIINLPGPKGTKYENNIYKISFELPKYYPFEPPKMKFITPIELNLVSTSGEIEIYSLFGEDWDPSKLIKNFIERINFFMSPKETRIDTYTLNKMRCTFEKQSLNSLIKNSLGHSFKNNQELSFLGAKVPVLCGFYTAHAYHYPIRLKPDDIWLLIIQGFVNHVNYNSESLRHFFVNFEGKQGLTIDYRFLDNINQIDKKILENFSEDLVKKMETYIGKELIDLLSPNFTTSTNESKIICKISIMGAFKKYFDYNMNICGCGVPYVVLEGTAEDYRKILDKAKKLKKYELDWYIDRIIPHLEKMIEAKEGKTDIEYFKNMIQKSELMDIKYGASGFKQGEYIVDALSGWFLNFFSYIESDNGKEIYKFEDDSIKIKDFNKLTSQIINVPFKVHEILTNKEYDMNFKVGFVGCDQNDKNEVFPVQGWWVNEEKGE